jgi:DNA-binding NarL/FixJ family response regulator
MSAIHEDKETVEETFAAGAGKVLIMDDEELIRESVEQLLTYNGYTVECAKDGDEAIELYKKGMEASEPFNAVILDLTVRGGIGGKEAVKKLQEIDPDVKAIVASGYSNDPVLANFKEYGFSGVFAKHDKAEELGKTLHKVLKG